MVISSYRRLGVVFLWLVAASCFGCNMSAGNTHEASLDRLPKNAQSPQASQSSAENQKAAQLFLVTRNGKMGYIDRTGTMIISAQFDAAEEFSEGLAAVAMKIGERSVRGEDQPTVDLQWGFVNQTGKIVIPAQFARVGRFSEGLAWVEVGDKHGRANYGMDKHGYVDKAGNIVIAPKLSFIFDPHGVDDGRADFKEGLAVIKLGNKQGFIDKAGRVAIAPQFDEADSFSEGVAAVRVGDTYGYIENTGKMILKPQFDFAANFSEGVALIRMGLKYGYINKAGEFIRRPEYSWASSFSEGLAAVDMGSDTGYINREGDLVVEVRIGTGDSFSEGIAAVRSDGKLGYIDKTGAMIIKPEFVGAERFCGGLARVYPNNMIEYGYIDRDGKYVWKPSG